MSLPTREYHIQAFLFEGKKSYRVVVSYGLMNTETFGPFRKQAEAREYVKAHAVKGKVKPLIIT